MYGMRRCSRYCQGNALASQGVCEKARTISHRLWRPIGTRTSNEVPGIRNAVCAEENEGFGSPDPDCASIDKFYPQLGYVNGNVSVISRRANTIKGDSRSEQVLRVALWMHLRQKGLKPSFEEVTNLLNEVYDFLAKT